MASNASMHLVAHRGAGEQAVADVERGPSLRRPVAGQREARDRLEGERGRRPGQRLRRGVRDADPGDRVAQAGDAEVAIQPAVDDRLVARRRAVHEVLRIEVRTRRIGAAGGVEEAEIAALVEAQEIAEGGIQAEEAVERQLGARRHLDGRTARVVEGIARRHHGVESVGRAALEDRHQDRIGARRARRSQPGREEERRHADGGRVEELSAREHHRPSPSAQWDRNSGLERSTAAACWTRFVATGSGSTSRKPMVASRVAEETGATNSMLASAIDDLLRRCPR